MKRGRPMTSVQAGMATRLKAQAGFTLTEVTIIVAIIGLLVLVAVPNYLDWNRKYKLKDAVATLHGNIGLARMNAINQSTTVTDRRSEEHTSELQSRPHLVCRLLLEKKIALYHARCRNCP